MHYVLTPSTAHLRGALATRNRAASLCEPLFFADGERGYRLTEPVKDQDVTVVASVLPDPASLFDILALCALLRENGSRDPELVVPYLGYARQDRALQTGEGSIGLTVAGLLRDLKPATLRVLDVHSPLVLAALGSAVSEASAIPLFADRLRRGDAVEVVVAPDAGARRRAEALAAQLVPRPALASVDKVRPRPNVAVARLLRGDVQGKRVVIVDDMIDTGGTICQAVQLVMERGARYVSVAATHGIFSGPALERLAQLPIEDILVTNSLPQPERANVRVLDVTPMLIP